MLIWANPEIIRSMVADYSNGPQQELSPKAPRWGVWSTLAWMALIGVVYILVQRISGPLSQMATLVANIAVIGVVILAVTLSRVSLKDYLALRWPSWRLVVIGWVLTVAMLALADFVTTKSGREVIPETMTDTFANSRDAGMGAFFLLVLTLIVIAPLGEEIVFRGFFYRGLKSGLGPLAAIIVTAASWAALHAQYEPFFMVQIFTYGLFLSWMRWQSDSLVLVIFLHALNNALALGQTNLV